MSRALRLRHLRGLFTACGSADKISGSIWFTRNPASAVLIQSQEASIGSSIHWLCNPVNQELVDSLTCTEQQQQNNSRSTPDDIGSVSHCLTVSHYVLITLSDIVSYYVTQCPHHTTTLSLSQNTSFDCRRSISQTAIQQSPSTAQISSQPKRMPVTSRCQSQADSMLYQAQ